MLALIRSHNYDHNYDRYACNSYNYHVYDLPNYLSV